MYLLMRVFALKCSVVSVSSSKSTSISSSSSSSSPSSPSYLETNSLTSGVSTFSLAKKRYMTNTQYATSHLSSSWCQHVHVHSRLQCWCDSAYMQKNWNGMDASLSLLFLSIMLQCTSGLTRMIKHCESIKQAWHIGTQPIVIGFCSLETGHIDLETYTYHCNHLTKLHLLLPSIITLKILAKRSNLWLIY